MRNNVWNIFVVSVCLSVAACSSGGSSGSEEEKVASCEQVKEFDDMYQECLKDARQ